MRNVDAPQTARLATLEQLRDTTVAAHLDPAPPLATLRSWFNRARIPRFKPNPCAKRGGGPVYYSVAAVERLLRRTTMGNLDAQ